LLEIKLSDNEIINLSMELRKLDAETITARDFDGINFCILEKKISSEALIQEK
jgi:hypothetical protein